jgi:hypothetical protein
MATLDTLYSLGRSVARGVPQLATGFVDLAALPLTMTGVRKPEQIFGSTAYLTEKGLLPPAQTGLLNQGTELASSMVNPAALALGLAGSIKPVGNVAKGLLSKTQFEKAQEIASKNAETLLGLPKGNTAMDRAKAMGFNVDKPVYHGTGADIKAFDPLLADTRRKTGTPTGSVVVTNNPEVANTYANQRNMLLNDAFAQNQLDYAEGGNVIPMYLKENKGITFRPKQTFVEDKAYKPYWNDLYDPRYPEPQSTNDFAQLALEKNKESATIKNILDNAMPSTAKGNTTFVFKPELLRSQFAAFDPARANEPDLLAAAMAFPISGLLEQPKDKKKKK